MSKSVEGHVESAEELVEEAQSLLKQGEAFAKGASGMGRVGSLAEGDFDSVAEEADNAREAYADRAIDAFKDAYLNAHRALMVAEGAKGLEEMHSELQASEVGQEILEGSELETGNVEKRDIYKARIQATRIMEDLQDQYGEALDFDGYVEKVMYHDDQ